MKDFYAIIYKLIQAGILDDVWLNTITGGVSFKKFNNVDEVEQFINSNHIDEILIKLIKGNNNFTQSINLHQVDGFRLNKKSLTVIRKPVFDGRKYIKTPSIRISFNGKH